MQTEAAATADEFWNSATITYLSFSGMSSFVLECLILVNAVSCKKLYNKGWCSYFDSYHQTKVGVLTGL